MLWVKRKKPPQKRGPRGGAEGQAVGVSGVDAAAGAMNEVGTGGRTLVDVPTIRPHHLSVATMRGQTLMLVRVYSSDGVVGLGEGTTIGGLAYGDESPETMKLAIDTYIAPLLAGQDATAVAKLMTRVRKHIRGNRFAKCAIETALLDAQGRRTGLAVSELLGGRQRDRLPVAWTLASGDTQTDIVEAERMLELRRHRVFKLKIGSRSVDDDVAHVATIKRALGDRAAVRVDVNMAWSETQAARGLPALADAGCELVEQPVATGAALARLVRRFPIALMADESLTGPASAFEIAKLAAADVFAVKIAQSGGLFGANTSNPNALGLPILNSPTTSISTRSSAISGTRLAL